MTHTKQTPTVRRARPSRWSATARRSDRGADDGAATRERANASTLERGASDDRRPATTGDARGEARLEATTRVDRATRRRR